jgi:hypothetical protein
MARLVVSSSCSCFACIRFSSTDVDAFYKRDTNALFIPSAILQPPFFSPHRFVFCPSFQSSYPHQRGPCRPMSRNLGALGSIIGHEFTHGFDDQGRLFDEHCMHRNWWSDHVQRAFLERAECVSHLYRFITSGSISLQMLIFFAARIHPSMAMSTAHSRYLRIWLIWGYSSSMHFFSLSMIM